MKTFHRFRYNFWRAVATFGHTIFRFGQWRSFKAYDKMGGRRRKTTRPFKKILDFVGVFVYNKFVVKKTTDTE